MKRVEADLLKDPILKALLVFAAPLLLSNLFQQLYNTMDIMLVGNILGDTSLAAIGACTAIYDLLIGFALGVGNGMSIVIARWYGSGDQDMLHRSVAGSLVIGAALSVLIMLISEFGLYEFLVFLDTPENIIRETYSYISCITMFVGILFAYNMCAGILRAVGDSFMPLVFLILSSVLNVILDYCFMRYLNMGIQGAAVATVIAQSISTVLCLIYIWKKKPFLIPGKKDFAVGKALYLELIEQGLSMGVMMMLVNAGSVVLQKSINGLGSLIIAGHTTARRIMMFLNLVHSTLGMVASTFTSQNRGAKQFDRAREGVKTARIMVTFWGLLLVLLVWKAGPAAVKLISGSSEKTVLETATRCLKFSVVFYVVLGNLVVLRTSMQGLGKKVLPLVSSVIELVGKIVFAIWIVPKMGYTGVMICEPVVWCLMCAQLMFSYHRMDWEKLV